MDTEDSLDASWDMALGAAESFDDWSRDKSTWTPPIMASLVTAAAATTVRRLYPFQSHARLCLSSGPRFWEPGTTVRIAPAFVSLDPEGHYNVWSGKPYAKSVDEYQLECATEDPRLAAAELERLLAGWS